MANCSIQLNRDQIGKLVEMVNHFKEVKHFTITQEHSSGIGPTIRVQFDLFEKSDTQVDITDVKEW